MERRRANAKYVLGAEGSYTLLDVLHARFCRVSAWVRESERGKIVQNIDELLEFDRLRVN